MKRLLTALLPVLSLGTFLVVGETILRLYHYLRFDNALLGAQPVESSTPSAFSPVTLDEKLGWRPTANYRFDGLRRSADGQAYAVRMSQDERGFRLYGNTFSGRPRVFVIGDSFTQAIEASDDKTYFGVIREQLGVEIFAFGCGGYGSLQEWMVFDRYFDAIRPDLVLWQFSTNDLVNNSPVLETASMINNNGLTRPYLTPAGIRYLLPSPEMQGLRRWALDHCRLCYLILHRVDKLRARFARTTVESQTAEGEPYHGAFLQAVRTTGEIIGRVRARAGATPMAAFVVSVSATEAPEYEAALREVSQRHGIVLLNGIAERVRAAAAAGAVVTADDGVHWNETGHGIAGRAIAAQLRELLPSGSRRFLPEMQPASVQPIAQERP